MDENKGHSDCAAPGWLGCYRAAEEVRTQGTLTLQSGRDSTIIAGGVHAGGSVSIGGVHTVQTQTIRRHLGAILF